MKMEQDEVAEEEEVDHAYSVPATYVQRACSLLCTCGELPPRDAIQPRPPFLVGRLRDALVAPQRPAESITADGRHGAPQSRGGRANCAPPPAL